MIPLLGSVIGGVVFIAFVVCRASPMASSCIAFPIFVIFLLFVFLPLLFLFWLEWDFDSRENRDAVDFQEWMAAKRNLGAAEASAKRHYCTTNCRAVLEGKQEWRLQLFFLLRLNGRTWKMEENSDDIQHLCVNQANSFRDGIFIDHHSWIGMKQKQRKNLMNFSFFSNSHLYISSRAGNMKFLKDITWSKGHFDIYISDDS